ncbi:MAG: putative metalloprotease CJM1_0395 family protein [Desulfobulbus sp.]|jgi:hypothetical protein
MSSIASSLNNSFIATYDRSGQGLPAFRSGPVTRIAPAADSSEFDASLAARSGDTVTLSAAGLDRARRAAAEGGDDRQTEKKKTGTNREGDEGQTKAEGREGKPVPSAGGRELSAEDLAMIRELKKRDQEVKAHETAHLVTAGRYARGGASYTYQQGPDGKRYAVGGEVPIDVSKESTPEATLSKMRTVKQAAMAPASPSAADRRIAAEAAAREAQALSELQAQKIQNREAQADDKPAADGDQNTDTNTDTAVPQTADTPARHYQPLSIFA